MSSTERHADIPAITRDELRERLAGARPPALFEVLPLGYWRKHHLPGALNAPPGDAPRIIAERVPDPHAPIVVYCWDEACPHAGRAARALAARGYTDVRAYHAGKADWIAAGLPMERPPRAPLP